MRNVPPNPAFDPASGCVGTRFGEPRALAANRPAVSALADWWWLGLIVLAILWRRHFVRQRDQEALDEWRRRERWDSRHPPGPMPEPAPPAPPRRPPKGLPPVHALDTRAPVRSSPVWPEDHDDGEDGYGAFVRRKWSLPGVACGSLAMMRGDRPVTLETIVEDGGRVYLNVVEDGVRKTYSGDGRHRWSRFGQSVDDSAFRAVLAGIPPATALAEEKRPQTPAEALATVRGETRGRVFVIGYRNGAGEASYRVISDVRRGVDEFSARCHFRWGAQRQFRGDRLTFVADAETGEEIAVADFLARPPPRRAGRQVAKGA